MIFIFGGKLAVRVAILEMRGRKFSIVFYLISILFIALPLTSLIFAGEGDGSGVFSNRAVLDALGVTLRSTWITMAVIFIIGTPAAYGAARGRFKGKRVLDIFLDIPMVLPPAVAGILLLMTFGRKGFIGSFFYEHGISIPFTITAVVMAQVFVALPIYVKTVKSGFESISIKFEQTAMTLGDSKLKTFVRVTLPMAKGSILTGGIMAWARAVAEFGATIMFAGNLRGKTQTIPLAIYTAMETDLGVAVGIAKLMVVFSFMLLVMIYFLARKGDGNVRCKSNENKRRF